jgi:hypothetical protein
MVVRATLIRIGQHGVRLTHSFELLFCSSTGSLNRTVWVERLGQLVI